MKIKLEDMPDDMKEQTLRMHKRMNEWRAKHTTDEVTVLWREIGGEKVIVVIPIRSALQIGLVHTNEHGYEMIKAMCEPEEIQPTMNQVRTAIELTL